MILISITSELNKEIKKILRKEFLKLQSSIFTKDDIEYKEKYKKHKIVITENNKEVIDYFSSLKKTVLVYDEIENKEYDNNNNVHICKTENELLEMVRKYVKLNKTKSIKKIIKISFCIIVLFTSLYATYATYQNYLYEQEQRIIAQKKENLKKQNIVFVGDSITYYYNVDKYYKDLPVVNSGISGNKAYDIAGKLKERIYDYNPTKVFLLIGTNDLSHQSDDDIVNNITKIVTGISENRPNAKIYVESVYPVNGTTNNAVVKDWMVGKRDNQRIITLNKKIRKICEKNKCEYINMYDFLTDENGNLKLEYTVDGLHMSEFGYKQITKRIMKYIEK